MTLISIIAVAGLSHAMLVAHQESVANPNSQSERVSIEQHDYSSVKQRFVYRMSQTDHGYSLLEARKYVAAERQFRGVLLDGPSQDASVGLADALLGQRRFEDARNAYATLLSRGKFDNFSAFQLKYAISLYATGHIKDALSFYAEATAGLSRQMPLGSSLLNETFEPHSTTLRQFESEARTAAAFQHLRSGSSKRGRQALAEARRALMLEPSLLLAQIAEGISLLSVEPSVGLTKLEQLAKTTPAPVKVELENLLPGWRAEVKKGIMDREAKIQKRVSKL